MINRKAFQYLSLALFLMAAPIANSDDQKTMRIFIFAGQSNIVGSDSKAEDIKQFPPFVGLDAPQSDVLFSYAIGRENKTGSDGWVKLQPVNHVVGPELSFAREITRQIQAPIGIIKCAAGGTHLGGDWNPDAPEGFKMYPLTMDLIKSSLAELDRKKIEYRIEGIVWHQGENDMFNEDYMANYGDNLANFLARWRQDLASPNLHFYIGELCTKTIWGMDLRPRMNAISIGQRAVTEVDPHADYVQTSHIGVEIGHGVGLHYHYGTLGQLEQGVNYAHAYFKNIGIKTTSPRILKSWPYADRAPLKLFILAGHRNMEGERAFTQQLDPEHTKLAQDNHSIAFKYKLGGGYKASQSWEPLGPPGYYDTFGPELSFAKTISTRQLDSFAIAKFTHSGSQMNDWTPNGSIAKARHLYPDFIRFVKEAINELEAKGHAVSLEGIFYHIGENEMSMPPYRKQTPQWLGELVTQSRLDFKLPKLKWFVSQQPPTDHERVNEIDVTTKFEEMAAHDENLIHIKAFDLPKQAKQLVIDTPGILRLGELLAEGYLKN
ncbi:MAG: hypothetical protein HOI66_09135 [Verrucomicrobia bacterium]|jgi:hypothetical protein|nr:hypothetical protein [Verrucomicrobiota bacterium]MDA7510738.1 sialate O-acetylesterase [Verrucomicrobiota bacterium]